MSPPVIRPGMPRFPFLALDKNPSTTYAKKKVGGAPVVFSAQATLAQNTATILNAQTLQSGFRTPYFIDEIRVSMVTDSYLVGAGQIGLTGLSGLVSILFQAGNYQFSQDAVPAGLFAPMFGSDYGNAFVGPRSLVDATNAVRAFSTVRWMLPKPLYMPAGDALLANVALARNAALTAAFGASAPCVTVTVTYVGRLLPQGYVAETRDIPWLAWWTKNASEAYTDSQTRFRNPFLLPAHVQRFTQRTYQSDVVASGAALAAFNEQGSVAQLYDPTASYEVVQMSDSRGYAITNKFIPLGEVFDATRHAWTFGRELASREQFNMQMRTENLAALPAGTDYVTNVGLVGYRSEAP